MRLLIPQRCCDLSVLCRPIGPIYYDQTFWLANPFELFNLVCVVRVFSRTVKVSSVRFEQKLKVFAVYCISNSKSLTCVCLYDQAKHLKILTKNFEISAANSHRHLKRYYNRESA